MELIIEEGLGAIVLIAVAALGFPLAALLYRRADPPAWATGHLVPEAISLAIAGMVAAGMALLCAVLWQLPEGARMWAFIAVFVVTPIIFVVAWRALNTTARLAAAEEE